MGEILYRFWAVETYVSFGVLNYATGCHSTATCQFWGLWITLHTNMAIFKRLYKFPSVSYLYLIFLMYALGNIKKSQLMQAHLIPGPHLCRFYISCVCVVVCLFKMKNTSLPSWYCWNIFYFLQTLTFNHKTLQNWPKKGKTCVPQ